MPVICFSVLLNEAKLPFLLLPTTPHLQLHHHLRSLSAIMSIKSLLKKKAIHFEIEKLQLPHQLSHLKRNLLGVVFQNVPNKSDDQYDSIHSFRLNFTCQ